MIENPLDERGNVVFFPGAPAPDVAAHRARTLQHLVDMAHLDAGYARYRAQLMATQCPDWHGDLLTRLDAALIELELHYPAPFVEIESRLPRLTRGPRGLPKHRNFHDSL